MKFFVFEKQACIVTWRYEVEAENEVEALEKYGAGEHSDPAWPPEIGDSLDFVQYDVTVEKAPDEFEQAVAAALALRLAPHEPL